MTNAFLFLARETPDDPSSTTSREWVLVCESQTAAPTRLAPMRFEPGIPQSNSSPAPGLATTPMPSLATPNSLLQARAWPLLGPRVIRPSRGRSLKGKISLGTSSSLRGNRTK